MPHYDLALWALAGLVILWATQALIAGYVAIQAKHVAGMPVTGGHEDPVYRIKRAHANTTENLPAFAIAAFLAIGVGAPSAWVNAVAVIYAAARAGHMVAYYADLRALRSAVYTIGLLATLAMAVIAALELV